MPEIQNSEKKQDKERSISINPFIEYWTLSASKKKESWKMDENQPSQISNFAKFVNNEFYPQEPKEDTQIESFISAMIKHDEDAVFIKSNQAMEKTVVKDRSKSTIKKPKTKKHDNVTKKQGKSHFQESNSKVKLKISEYNFKLISKMLTREFIDQRTSKKWVL